MSTKMRVSLVVVLLSLFAVGMACAFLQVEWRYPWGPPGDIKVHYTIPWSWTGGKGASEFWFTIAGHIERIQFVPTSSHNAHAFVMLYMKTTEGWYETPIESLGGPIDWTKGVEVQYYYPVGMVLRKQTRSPIHGFYPAFGPFRWRSSPFGFGDYLDEGDIASVHFRNAADGTRVTVHRTNGLEHSGYQSGKRPGMAVEVNVFEK